MNYFRGMGKYFHYLWNSEKLSSIKSPCWVTRLYVWYETCWWIFGRPNQRHGHRVRNELMPRRVRYIRTMLLSYRNQSGNYIPRTRWGDVFLVVVVLLIPFPFKSIWKWWELSVNFQEFLVSIHRVWRWLEWKLYRWLF